jgi:hypothetical protein
VQALQTRGAAVTALPVQARSGQQAVDRPYKLEPGAPISAQLITGDLVVGAVGTVTMVDGKSLLAFGHPVLGDTRARYAAAPAFINTIVAAQDIPFKLAENVAKPFGVFSTDRPYGVGGLSGVDPGFLPFDLTVKNAGVSKNVKVSLAPIESFVAALSYATGLSMMDQALEGNGPGSALLLWTLSFTDRNAVTLRDRVGDANDLGSLAARHLAVPIALLAENPFQASGLKSVRASIEVQPFALANLVRIEPETRTVKPGQTITLNVRLQPYRAAPIVRRLTVKIPNDQPEGALRLIVRGGLTPRPDNNSGPRDPWEGILSFDDLLERLKNRISGENILVETEGNGLAGANTLAANAQTLPVAGLIPVLLNVQKDKP